LEYGVTKAGGRDFRERRTKETVQVTPRSRQGVMDYHFEMGKRRDGRENDVRLLRGYRKRGGPLLGGGEEMGPLEVDWFGDRFKRLVAILREGISQRGPRRKNWVIDVAFPKTR